MKIYEGPLYKDKSFRIAIVFGIVAIVVLLIIGQTELALGLFVGSLIGIFNYWLMYDALKKGKDLSSKEANRMFFGRYFLRMIISVTALFIGFRVGIMFTFGILAGLFLHLFTYLDEIFKLGRKDSEKDKEK